MEKKKKKKTIYKVDDSDLNENIIKKKLSKNQFKSLELIKKNVLNRFKVTEIKNTPYKST